MPHQRDKAARDDELVSACLKGDESAWASLIRRYRRLIYTIPLRFGMPPSAAEEIFQEVCVNLLQSLHTVRDQSRLSAWIVTVTRRACIEKWRHAPVAEDVDSLSEQFDASDADLEARLITLERRHTLQQALELLDKRCRRLLEALFLSEEPPSYQEIAQELGIAEGSVGPIRARCLDKLRKFIVKFEGSKPR